MNTNFLKRVPFFFILMVCFYTSFSQANKQPLDCPCTVSAGPDKQICEPGGAVQLNGSTTGNPLVYNWTPTTGLNNSHIKNPVATVTETTTYTLSILCLNNTNLVDNADFQQGNTGFTSDYTYSNNLVPEGLYSITNNPQSVHPGFAPCTDHTGGNGQMMVVNGAGTPNLNVWCQTINVQPNTLYAFETWVCSVVGASPAFLQFSIDGNAIGPIFQAPSATCQWVQFAALWDSGSNTTATICIVNQNTTLGGNDFALDDISFKEVCTLTDEVTITVNPVQHTDLQASICEGQTYKVGNQSFQNEGSYQVNLKSWKMCDSIVNLDLSVIEVNAQIDPPDNLDCGLTEIILHGDQSSFGPEYTYKWTTTNGHIVSDPTLWEVIVDKPGQYKLTVTYTSGGITCTKFATVTVGTDYKKPLLDAGKDGQITCTDTLLTLHGTAINPNTNFKVHWTTTNGKIVSSPDTLNPVVGGPGMYIMQLTSNFNGCSALDTVIVTADSTLPKSIIGGPNVLNCYKDQVWLDGSSSDKGAGFSFVWNTFGGKIDSNPDSLNILVSTPGEYELVISDLTSGCKTSSKFLLSSDKQAPLNDAGLTDTISCQFPSLQLTGTSSIPDSIASYIWSSPNGKILSGIDTLNPTIGAPGLYYFKVLNKINGCFALDSVLIAKDINSPNAFAGIDDTLTCSKKSINLSAAGSSVGGPLIYSWTTGNGNLTGPTNTINTTCDKTGKYAFTVSNPVNGCVTSDTVSVFIDTIPPIANAGVDNTLTCKMPILDLDGSKSSSGIGYNYSWTSPSGNIISGANTKTPKIDKAGIYSLVVSNIKNGCSNQDQVEIFEDKVSPNITLPQTAEITCKIPEIQLTGINNSLPGQFTYQWATSNGNIKTGDKTLIVTVTKEGLYTLTTTNTTNGCTSLSTIPVVNLSELPIVNVGKDTSLSCSNKTILLNASYQYSGKDLSFVWTSTGNPVTIGVDPLKPSIGFPGLYTLTVQDTITGCKSSDVISVTMDTVSPKTNILMPENISCKMVSVSLTIANNTNVWNYLWSTVNGNIVSGANNASAIVDKSGTYLLIITDQKNGCTSSLNSTVGEDKTPPTIDAGPAQLLTCTKANATLSGKIIGSSQNKTVYWTLSGQTLPASNTLSPIVDKTGLYTLVVTDELNGCTASDTTSVLKNNNVPVSFVADVLPPGCKVLSSVTVSDIVGGVGPYQYAINGGAYQSSNVFSTLKPGNYNVAIQDVNGCVFDEDLMIPEPQQFTLDLPSDLTIEYGGNQQLHPILNIPQSQVEKAEWTPIEGLSCSDCIEPFASPVQTLIYKLTITDKTGCTAKSKVRIFVLKDFGLYIPNAFSPNADGINDKWYVFGDPTKVVKINKLEIFDRWGEKMFEASDFPINDPAFGWNGKSRNKYLNPAVFVFYLEAEFIDGSTQLFKGDINLMR